MIDGMALRDRRQALRNQLFKEFRLNISFFCRFCFVFIFTLLSLELCRCSADLFLSSRPRTESVNVKATSVNVKITSVNVKNTHTHTQMVVKDLKIPINAPLTINTFVYFVDTMLTRILDANNT